MTGYLFLLHGLQKIFGLFGGVDGAGGTVPTGSICFVFLYIATRGSGVWSVDALRGKASA